VPLGRWVLAEACRQGRVWQDAHPDSPPLVSVNLAARQVRDQGIVKDVAQILAETGLNPDALQLELTESAVMGTTDESLATLHALAELGVRIAIDDFGTGYSNLAYLRSLPVHGLKLAGPFLTGTQQVDIQIVATLVQLAHTLDLDVTAESVETAEQADRLRALGCDTAQGWYFAAAGPPDAVSPILGRRLS
jgi:EAL domain-containing protein (putative c-di-GMP-specific phosphodiesterase class I)